MYRLESQTRRLFLQPRENSAKLSICLPRDLPHVIKINDQRGTKPSLYVSADFQLVLYAISTSAHDKNPDLPEFLLDNLRFLHVESVLKQIVKPRDSGAFGRNHIIVASALDP